MRLPESIVYMTLFNSRGLQHVHISAKQLFHAPLHPCNKKIISPRFWETRDQRSPGSFADVDSDESDLSLDRDEGTEGESDSEVITPGPHNLNLHLLNLTMLLCHLTMSALNKG